MTASPLKDWQSCPNAKSTKQIWDEQVDSFWDMTWVLTEDPKNSAALDVRKNWRSYLPPEQAGVKCMMMEGWQELSGAVKPSEEVKIFWQNVRDNGKLGMKTDLREKEHLCAIAFIKRRFPRYFDEKLVVDMPNSWTLKGWKVKAGRPSVAYMAAVHGLKNVLLLANHHPDIEQQLWRFHNTNNTGGLFLEEYRFESEKYDLTNLINVLEQLMQRDNVDADLKRQLVIVSNDSFTHLVNHATPVNAHIALDSKTKTTIGGALNVTAGNVVIRWFKC